jgi:hypothetical protein
MIDQTAGQTSIGKRRKCTESVRKVKTIFRRITGNTETTGESSKTTVLPSFGHLSFEAVLRSRTEDQPALRCHDFSRTIACTNSQETIP